MPTDLSNREKQIYDYVKEMMRSEFPNADVRDDGEFMEMFALPHVKLFEPLMTFIDRLKLMQSLENATNMTGAEMDEVSRSHYTSRNTGDRSSGTVTFCLSDIPESGVLVFPAGLEALSKNDLRFRSTETVTLNEASIADFYDPSTFSYRIPIPFASLNTGSENNVKIGDIKNLDRGNIPNLIEVVNEIDFDGGSDSESNTDLANRIRNEAFAPNLGIKRGYVRYLNSFSDVKETLVAGYGHPLMRRDVIGEVNVPGITLSEGARQLHWGTKVDAYVRGTTLTERTEFMELILNDEGKLTAQFTNVPVVEILDVRLFSSSGELNDPELDQSTLYVAGFTLEKDEGFETEGTLEEIARIIVNDDRLSEGSLISVRYHYNGLISNIHDAMYLEENRPPTADVKIKEMNKKFIFGAMVVKLNSMTGLRDSDRSLIRQKLSLWVDKLPSGAELQFSDLQEPLTLGNQVEGNGIVDYIRLPYQFIVMENDSRYLFYCLSQRKRDVTDYFKAENMLLDQMFIRFKDSVTTYDFFDLLHSFTNDNAFEEHIKNISFISSEWGKRSEIFIRLRELSLKGLVERRLSPSKESINENEYFELGETYIYEERPYTQLDWEQMILLCENLSKGSDEVDMVRDMYYLAIYVITLVYMSTTDEYITDRTKLYQFVRKLVERTPVEFEFDI